MTWKEMAAEYWDEAAGAILTVFLALNSVYGWLPAEVVGVIVMAAASVGVTVMKVRSSSAAAKAEDAIALAHGAHNRLSANEGILPMLSPSKLPPGTSGT